MRATRVVAGLVAVGLVAAGCGGKRPTESGDSGAGGCEAAEGRVTIATGNTGGVYYTLGGGLAQLISDNTPIKASAAETGASVQNIQQLVAGDYDIAFSLADSAADAFEGTGSFDGKKQDIKALARIYPNFTQVVVRADSGIETVEDMKGKKISTGSPKSGTEVIANRLLEAAGLDPASDISAQRLALRQTVDQMKSGQLDGFVWSGGLPTPEVTDLTTSMKDDVRFVEGCIASIAQQSYRNFTCLLNDDRSADGSTQVIQRLVAGDERFIWHRPTQRYTSARERLLGGGALGVQPDDVVISLKGCDCFSHTNVLNRLNHLYSENPELWLTFGNFVTDPFIPGWPTASFPPAVWQSGGFRAAGVPIGAAVPLTFRGFLLEQPAVARTPVLPPPDYESTANDAALLLPLLELSTAAHAYPLAEVLCVRSVAKQANADPERRRRDVQLQGALRAHPPARALPSAPRPENPGSHTEDIGSVAWIAPIYEATGYADEARNYVHGLQDLGVAVAARSINQPSERYRQQLADATRARLDGALASAVDPDFIAVVHFPAFAFQPIAGAAYTIGRTMYETDSLPAEWVQRCNQLDEIWVPTRFNLETFRRAGVTARLVRIPGGIDTAKFRPGHAPLPLPGTRGTVFLSVFKWEHRKGWDVLLRAWARAFAPGDDVTLVLRTYAPDAPQGADHQLLIERRITNFLASELGRTRAEVAPIVVLTDEIADEDLPRLYAAAHAYAAPSRGEGWGRPQMEAMACGLPVLATRWSGTTEFMTDENSLLIDVEALVEEQSDPALRGHRWAEPSAEHLASLMRRVCSELEATADLGRRAAKDMREHWGWDRAARAAVARLGEVRRELSARPAAAGASGAPGARGPRGGADSAGGGPSGATPVRWEGSQFVHHSLARVNRELCRELLAGGAVDLEVIPFEAHEFTPDAASPFHGVAERINRPLGRAAAVHVRHQWPPRFDAPPEGAWVMIQPWEFGGIPGSWVAPMRDAVDEIWVPSAWVRQCYVESGVPADKVVVVPNGVDTDLYRPEGPRYPLATAKRFKFLAVGGLIPRKGIDILIETYLTTFTAADDVCLVVKGLSSQFAYHGNPLQQRVAEIAAATRGHAQLPEIELVPDTLGDEEIAALYRSCDAFVSPFRGEGFGLPIAEAMAAALPVIVTGAGPVLEFCDAGTGYLIPSADVTVPDHNGLPASSVGYWWAEPDRKAFATLMRQVAAEPEAARRVGRRARARIVERFRWTHAAAAATARILTLAGRTPVRHAPTADFNPAVEPLRLDERRGFAFLHHPNWHDAAWKDVLASYVRAFDAGDDVTLVLCLDPRQGIAADTAATAILEVLAATRGSSETAPPDLLLVPDDLTLAGLGALYTAVDCVVCGGDPVQATRARHAGKPVLARLAPGAWRAAYAEGTSARRAQPLYSTP
jgi:TRAP transporter TAXI family solute receptor